MYKEVPRFEEFMLPALKAVNEGCKSLDEIEEEASSKMNLTDDQLKETLPSGRRTKAKNRTHWAVYYLYRAGLIEKQARGINTITPEGEKALNQNIEKIDKDFLYQYPSFKEFLSKKNSHEPSSKKDTDNQHISEETPDEDLEKNFQTRKEIIMDDILDKLLTVSPRAFEYIVCELLSKMGFGDVKPRSGVRDEGLDGEINQDKLGLVRVYLQAKRYKKDHSVGRPDIQKFVGSLNSKKTKLGLFITTSNFSKDAEKYVNEIDMRVVLINGDKMSELMYDYGLGVNHKSTYEVKDIEESYFDDL